MRHGADFGATSAEDYASQASEFLQRGVSGGAQVKVDGSNAKGTTRTFYKPDPAVHGYPSNQAYFDAQHGGAP